MVDMHVSKESLKLRLDSMSAEMKQLAMEIHENPEVGLHEEKACQLHTDFLRKHGFEVETGIAGFPTAFLGVYKSGRPGPVIAFIDEYDALPGVGHGCGHNLIGTASSGAAIASCAIVDEYGGELRVYGTPAEENFGSKAHMVDQGFFKDCDVAIMSHPSYMNIDNANVIAVKAIIVEFYGRPAHAAAAPELGINALDAAISMFNMVNALRQQTKDDARIHGIISDGGKVPNIIPDYAKAEFCVRAGDRKYCYELCDKVERIAEAAAIGTGCTFKISQYHHSFDDAKQNLFLSELASKNMESFGEKVIKLNHKRVSGSSDFGNVSYVTPSLQFSYCIGIPDTGNPNEIHTVGFARDAGSEQGLEAMIRMSKVLAMTAYDIISEPENLRKIREEFESTD